MRAAPILDVLEALPKARPVGRGKWKGCCPGHEDNDPSLNWEVGEAGQVLMYDFGHCANEEVVAALGMTMADLYPPKSNGATGPSRPAKPKRPKSPERRWTIHDVDGKDWTHYRDDSRDPPRWWDKGAKLARMRPYGSELPIEDPVHVVEGEPAADALRKLNVTALATLGTSYRPEPAALECLRGHRVVLWPDADSDPKVGRAHMLDMAARLSGIAASVEWIEPPPDVFDGWDAADADEATVRRLIATAGPVPHPDLVDLASLFVNVVDYCARVPDDVPWFAEPLAYFGGVSLIAGIWKGGKSTLMAHLQRARETGEPFLGHAIPVGPTALVTEEGGVPVKHKVGQLRSLDVLDKRTTVLAGLDFDGLLGALRDYCAKHTERAALFLDTFAVFGDIEDENNAVEVTGAIVKLTGLAQETGAAVILVHHTNKNGGSHGRGIRGSGAIPATVDIFAVLDYDQDGGPTARTLKLEGRVIEPAELRLAFDPLTRTYTLVDEDAAHLAAIEKWLAKVPADGDGLAISELADRWGLSRRKTYDRVEHLQNVGRLCQKEGKRGNANALLHWSIPPAWRPPGQTNGQTKTRADGGATDDDM